MVYTPTPTDDQRLNIDQCNAQMPENASEWGTGWYCDYGYRANGILAEEVDEPNPRTRCVLLEPEFGKSTPIPPPTSTIGLGNIRNYYDPSIIDRGFDYNSFISEPRSFWYQPGGSSFPLNPANGPDIEDRFRAFNGLYWTWDWNKNDLVYVAKPPKLGGSSDFNDLDTSKVSDPRNTTDSLAMIKIGIKTTMQATDESQGEMASSTYQLKIVPNTDTYAAGAFNNYTKAGHLNSEGEWVAEANLGYSQAFSKYVESMVQPGEDKYFYDHACQITTPFNINEMPAAFSSPAGYYKITPTYNFHIPRYESNAQLGEEAELVNLYMESLTTQNGIKNDLFEKWDWKEYISNLEDSKLQAIFGSTIANITEDSEGDSKIDAARKKFTNVLITPDLVADFREYYFEKEKLPIYMDFEFSTDINTGFADILRDGRLAPALMKRIIKDEAIVEKGEIDENEPRLLEDQSYIEFISKIVDNSTTDITGSTPRQRRAIDITSWFDIDNIDNEEDFPIISTDELDKAICINTSEEPGSCDPPLRIKGYTSTYDFTLQRNVLSPLYHNKVYFWTNLLNKQGDLRNEIVKHTRTFQEVLEGKLAHSETVIYRIEKSDSDGNVIQSFYLPNSNKINIYKFIDSQVKYGKEYTYNVYAWQIIYGSKYKYTNTHFTGNEAIVTVTHQPSVKIIEVPYIQYVNKVLDAPPTPPEVSMTPYYKTNDKLMINFNGGMGKLALKPVAIEPVEADEITDLMRAQNQTSILEYLSHEDRTIGYKIYRLDIHPSRYLDFSLGVIKEIESLKSTAATVVEDLMPNKKYWYIFRTIDAHNHLSYPSSIYQVELVDDGNSIYPLINTVKLKGEDESTRDASKKLKKLMQIIPADGHIYLNDAREALLVNQGPREYYFDPNKFRLGTKDKTLWGERFKIRLTSKKTGRKIDINVVFDNIHIKNQP